MTTSPLELRAFVADLEVRSGGDGRTLSVLAAPFDREAEIWDGYGHYFERIERGAFQRTIAERGDKVRVFTMHDTARLPIGRAQSLREDAAGLVAELRISRTQAGDDALTLVRDRVVDGVSIGFNAVRDTWSADRSRRTLREVRLNEISLVHAQAYNEAKVLAVRSRTAPSLMAARRQLLELQQQGVPSWTFDPV